MKREIALKIKKHSSTIQKMFFVLLGLMVIYCIFKSVRPIYVNRWDGKTQLNGIIEFKEKMWLIAFDPDGEKVTIVNFPNDLVVEAFGGYGEFMVKYLEGLADQENKPEIFSKSIEYHFGFPIDFRIVSSIDPNNFSFDGAPGLLTQIIRHSFFSRTLESNRLSKVNLFLLRSFIGHRQLLWSVNNAEEMGMLEDKEGKKLLKKEDWDNWAKKYLVDSQLQRENLGIGIYNTTQTSGLAAETARTLRNLGIRVVKTDNYDGGSGGEGCYIKIAKKEDNNSLTVKRIEKILGCKIKIAPGDQFEDFTDVNIYLDEKYLSELKKNS